MSVDWQTSVAFDLFTKLIIDDLTDSYKVISASDVVFMNSIDLSIECGSKGISTLFTVGERNKLGKYEIPLLWNGKDYSLSRYLINYDTVKSKLVGKVLAILAVRVRNKIILMKCDKEIKDGNESIHNLKSKLRLFLINEAPDTTVTDGSYQSDKQKEDCKSYDIIKINE